MNDRHPDSEQTPESPLEFLLRAPVEVGAELSRLVPRLVERTVSQVGFLAALADRLGCTVSERLSADQPLADVLPMPRPGARVVSAVDVEPPATGDAPGEGAAPAKKAPATAKKAPATAKKAPATAKKAPATAKKAPATATATRVAATQAAAAPTAAPTPTPAPIAVIPGELAIPGYDELAASQVIPRLDALSSDERAAIERHELANRGRRTILNRLHQLRVGSEG